jgi:hypothetical protein
MDASAGDIARFLAEMITTIEHEVPQEPDSNVFQLGRVIHIRPRPRPRPRPYTPPLPSTHEPTTHDWSFDWSKRTATPPKPGMIRLLADPSPDTPPGLLTWWMSDRSLREWNDDLRTYETDVSENVIARAMGSMKHVENIKRLFAENQRARWLGKVVFHRWTQFVWRKRTQCNVDLIEMEPVADRDAVFLTDTKHHQIYRFHRRDVFNNLLSNLTMADEFLPCPRAPTNPWTNAPLSYQQIIGLCGALVADYGTRGRCPPVLFAAYCASRFSMRRFQKEHASLLAQQAIMTFFKDLNDNTFEHVFDTMVQLVNEAGLDVSPTAVRRWLRETPQTKFHRGWLLLVRDYTLYINLHVQIRPGWNDEDAIYRDVRALFQQTPLPDPVSVRVRQLRTAVNGGQEESNPLLTFGGGSLRTLHSTGLLGLPMILHPPALPQQATDVSGGDAQMELSLALQLIQQSLFRF